MKRKNRVLLIIMVIMFVFLSRSFFIPNDLAQIAVVTAIGIDKTENSYIVSANIIAPRFETGVTKNTVFVEAKGITITNGFQNLSQNLGKKLGLSHLNLVVLASNVLNELPLYSVLEPVLKTKTQNQNAKVIYTQNKAREILNLETSAMDVYDPTKMASVNANATILKQVSELPFIKNKIVTLFTVEKNPENNALSWNENLFFIKPNDNKIMISSKEANKLMFFKTQKNYFLNTKEKLGEDVFLIKSHAKLTPSFYNNIPRLTLKLNLEVNAPSEVNVIQLDTLKNTVELSVKKEVAEAFLLLKNNNIDVFNFEKLFEGLQNKNWKAFKNNNKSGESFMSKLELFTHIEVSVKQQITLAY